MNKVINLLVIIAFLDHLNCGIESKFQSIFELSKENQIQDSFEIIEKIEASQNISQLSMVSSNEESLEIIDQTKTGFVESQEIIEKIEASQNISQLSMVSSNEESLEIIDQTQIAFVESQDIIQYQKILNIINQIPDIHIRELFLKQLEKLSCHTNLIPDMQSHKIIRKTSQDSSFIDNNVIYTICKGVMDKFYSSLFIIIDVITHINTIDIDSTIKNDIIKNIIDLLNIQDDKLLFLQIITKEIKDLSIIQLFVNNIFAKSLIISSKDREKFFIDKLDIQDDKLLFLQILINDITKEIKDVDILELFINNIFPQSLTMSRKNIPKIIAILNNIHSIKDLNDNNKKIKYLLISKIINIFQSDKVLFLYLFTKIYNLSFIEDFIIKLDIIPLKFISHDDICSEIKALQGKLKHNDDDKKILTQIQILKQAKNNYHEIDNYIIKTVKLIKDVIKTIINKKISMEKKQVIIKTIFTKLNIKVNSQNKQLFFLWKITEEIKDLYIIEFFVHHIVSQSLNVFEKNRYIIDYIINNIRRIKVQNDNEKHIKFSMLNKLLDK